MEEKEIGKVFRYFGNIGVAAIELSSDLKVGDKIRVKGATTDFETEVESIQMNNESLEEAHAGDKVGIKVPEKARPNDKVFSVQ